MYDKAARARLTAKTEYELWLLQFLSGSEDRSADTEHAVDMRLSNRDHRADVYLRTAKTPSRGALAVMNAMSPLTFAAAYKALDMVFEWILEENYATGTVPARQPPSRWRFDEKTRCIGKLPLELFPPPMRSAPGLRERLVGLYVNLLGFRNEIVHRSSFSVHDGKLEVAHEAKGSVEVLACIIHERS